MKKILLIITGAWMSIATYAQVQRMVMIEGFSNASCPPCAAQNPAYKTMLDNNATKVIAMKYQTNWPGVDPMNAQTQAEVGPRVTYYNFNGVPYGLIDGTIISGGSYAGALNGLDQTEIDTRYAVSSPFDLALTHNFSADMDSVFISATISTPATFSGTTLKLHVAMVEKEIVFAAAPGSNGETEFHNVMRKMYPDANGTALPATWSSGNTQTYNFAAPIPSYIYDYTQIAVVAFIQENTNKVVHQAAMSDALPLVNFLKNVSLANIPVLNCSGDYSSVTFNTVNQGNNTITNCTVNQQLNNGTVIETPWSGTIAPGATQSFNLATVTGVPAGSNTLKAWVSNVNNNGILTPVGTIAQKIINVMGTAAPAPVTSNFSSTTFPPANWVVDNYESTLGWSRQTPSSGGGSGSARFYSFLIPSGQSRDIYVQKTDLTSINNPSLTFDVAYAQYQAENDRLIVSLSTDCGTTWTQLYNKAGATLKTAPATTNSFVPTASQWRVEFVDLASYASANDVIFRFRGTSNYGNNIFVDNINIATSTASVEDVENGISLHVYPNPASENAYILVNMKQENNMSISIINMVGEVVSTINKNNVNAGEQTITLPLEGMAAGVYNVAITIGNTSHTQRLIVQ